MKALELMGRRFSHLEVIGKANGKYRFLWLCRCDCGNFVERDSNHLTRSKLSACHKCRPIIRKEASTTHGDRQSRLWICWQNMKQRCYNRNQKSFQYYGGKGIRVCEEWQSYVGFKKWAMANGYKFGLTIERKNSDAHYDPSNCEWITQSENSRRAHLAKN